MKIVILNGGKGTRLGLSDRPKPMVEVDGKPLLERLVETGREAGFADFVFLNGHLGEVIEQHFGNGGRFGVRITHRRESTPLGTAGAVAAARDLLTDPFILLYGDILIDVDLAHFARFHAARGGVGSLFVHPNDHPHDSDLVVADEHDLISRFVSKPHPPGALLPNLVSAALYVLTPAALDRVPGNSASDWGHDVFPALLADHAKLYAYRSIEYAKDIGTPERLARGEGDVRSGRVGRLSRRLAKPAIFLDRDGVLNVERGGVHRPEELVLIEGAGPAVRAINRAGIPAICVTNQPDVAKGFISPSALTAIFAALDTRLAEHGAYLDAVYVCPHHPEAGWPGEVSALKVACRCRKPLPGMLIDAASDHRLALDRSWLIGDRQIDLAAARAAGARAALVRTGHGGSDAAAPAADLVATDIAMAVAAILPMMADDPDPAGR